MTPVTGKADYLRFLARFLGFGVNGAGGAVSIRRSTSSGLGVVRFFVFI